MTVINVMEVASLLRLLLGSDKLRARARAWLVRWQRETSGNGQIVILDQSMVYLNHYKMKVVTCESAQGERLIADSGCSETFPKKIQ